MSAHDIILFLYLELVQVLHFTFHMYTVCYCQTPPPPHTQLWQQKEQS